MTATGLQSACFVVLGVGNVLRGDDGAGVHAARRLAGCAMPGVTVIDGGTLGLGLLERIADARGLVVVDAARLGGAPGDLRVWEDADMDAYLAGSGARSVHEVGLRDLLAAARCLDRLPARRALVGIEPGYMEWSEFPSAAVAAAIDPACAAVRDLISGWTQ